MRTDVKRRHYERSIKVCSFFEGRSSYALLLRCGTLTYRPSGKLLDTLVGCVAKQVLAGSVEKVLEDIAVKQKGATRKDNSFDDMAP